MRRIAVIACTFVVLVAGAAVVVYRVAGPEARRTGEVLYIHRHVLQQLAAARRLPAEVLWVGDSTLMVREKNPSYVDLVGREVLGPLHVRSAMVAAPGIDFYSYWSLAGPITALHPKVIVLIANLRTFIPEGNVRGLTDLTAEIPIEDLPRTLALPYYVRGMTAPRLMLVRALRTDLGEDVFLRFEGVRKRVQESEALDWLGPVERQPAPGEAFGRYVAVSDRILAQFDRPLGPSNPLVRLGAAGIARMAASGAAVLVVVTPIPWERGIEAHHYDESRFRARIEMLRRVVESSGGRLLDLHRALPKDGFRDNDCHFNAAGAGAMAKLVGPEIVRLLAERGGVRGASGTRD